jgi:uncharacterized protein YcfJ
MKVIEYNPKDVEALFDALAAPAKKPGRDKEIVIRTSAIGAALGAFIANKFGLQGYEQVLSAGIGILLAEVYDRVAFALKNRFAVK